MNLNEIMIIFDVHEMPTIWTCTKSNLKEMTFSRRDKCDCGGDIGIQMLEDKQYYEFCLACKKEFR